MAYRRAWVRFRFRVPDAERLSPYLLEWDEEGLNSLSENDQNALLATINRWREEGKIPRTEFEDTFELVREGRNWRILLNWKSSVQAKIVINTPESMPVQVEPVPNEISFEPGEPFTVTLRVENRSHKELWARVAHTVEPEFMAKYLGLADCGAFVPFRLAPGEQEENISTFLVWTDMPEEIKEFKMIYTFEMEKP
ncbi:MAG: cytochrome c oxidase assembly protein [Deltaproteobacteria bacterium]|nr:cytochrome c oxidase assembly protein [Deltaproteobacteria bacterium]